MLAAVRQPPVNKLTRATGLRNLLLHDTAQDQIWLENIQIASPSTGPGPT
ncbi:hypothetical protein [Streptomyces sp. NPDC048277]